MMHGLMLAAAIEAGAVRSEEPEAEFGRAGSVVLGEIIAARALTPVPAAAVGGLGAAGGLSAAWLSFGATRSGDMTYKSAYADPAVDVFVTDKVSVGAILGGGVTSVASSGFTGETWQVTAMPRVGSVFAIAPDVSVWARFAAGVTLFDGAGQRILATALRATFDVPFVLQLSRHVVLQAGPQISYVNFLAGPDQKGFSGGASGGLSIVL